MGRTEKKFKAGARPGSRRRGAALVEFAMVVTVFLLLLLGMLQFGIYLSATNAIVNTSREGARFAAVQSSSDTAAADAAIKQHIQDIMPANLRWSEIKRVTIRRQPPPANTYDRNRISVQIDYDMRTKMLFPSSSTFLPVLQPTYTATTTMMVE